VQAFLDRIDLLNPRVNAYIAVTRDHALVSARAAEKAIMAGKYRGPLHGLPYAPKDILATKGILTTNGSKVTATNVPTFESTITRRMNQAGAILIGKLNLLEFGWEAGSCRDLARRVILGTSTTRPRGRRVGPARRLPPI